MFTRTFTIILSTISSLVYILNTNIVTGDEFSPSKYSVTELKNKLISRLLEFSPIGLDDLFTALSNPDCYNNVGLNKLLADILFKYTKELFDDERFLHLDDKALMIIVKQDSISVPEIIVWEAILKWGKHKTKSNDGKIVREKISPLLEFIRFCSMDLKEFYRSVIPANVLTPEEAIELSTLLINNKCNKISYMSNESGSRYVPQNVEQEQQTYLHYYVKNITELREDKWYYSDLVELGYFRWKIMIKKKGTSFLFYINCSQSLKVKTNPSWEIRAALDYILVNQSKGGLHEQQSHVNTFNKNSHTWGYSDFIEWNDVINPNKGFIKGKNIFLLVRVKLNPK